MRQENEVMDNVLSVAMQDDAVRAVVRTNMTKKNYQSKTFTDYTHPMSDIVSGMCGSGIVVTGLKEFERDLSGGFTALDGCGYPMSMIIQGKKI